MRRNTAIHLFLSVWSLAKQKTSSSWPFVLTWNRLGFPGLSVTSRSEIGILASTFSSFPLSEKAFGAVLSTSMRTLFLTMQSAVAPLGLSACSPRVNMPRAAARLPAALGVVWALFSCGPPACLAPPSLEMGGHWHSILTFSLHLTAALVWVGTSSLDRSGTSSAPSLLEPSPVCSKSIKQTLPSPVSPFSVTSL